MLKKEIPDTYSVREVVVSGLGDMPIEKRKGEGGNSCLAKRIGDNFQNKFLRLIKL